MTYQMPKCKAITKGCPACSKQVAVACKNCPCGHTFFVARRSAGMPKQREDQQPPLNPVTPPAEASDPSTVRFRRTERIKRDKPDFYDASEYDKQRKKSQRQKLSASFSEDRDDGNDDEASANSLGKRGRGRRRRKGALAGDMVDDKRIEDDEAMPPISAMKQFHFSVSLSEINRKLLAVNPVF